MRSLFVSSVLLFGTAAAKSLVGCYSASVADQLNLQTGDDYTWQSSDHCSSLCADKGFSAFALTDGSKCFCGNTVPGDSFSTSSDCNSKCVGYPYEDCGGDSDYTIFLTGAGDVSYLNGDSDGSSSDSSSSATDSATSATSSATQSSVPSTVAPATSTTTQASTSSTQPTSTALSYTTIISESTVVIFSTNGPTPTTSATDSATDSATTSGASDSAKTADKSSTPVGAIVGGVIGGVVALAAVAFVVFICMRRRAAEDDDDESSGHNDTPPLENPFASPIEDKLFLSPHNHSDLPQPPPNTLKPSGGIVPIDGQENTFVAIDQRMNPFMLGTTQRMSVTSLADARDYSRKILQVTNPDDQ